jgi:hypothetical protein
MPLVAGPNIVGLRSLRALHELCVAWIGGSRRRGSRVKELALLAEHGEHGIDLVGCKRKSLLREHCRALFEDLFREAGMR